MPPAPLDYAPTPTLRRKRLIASLILLSTFSSLGYLLHQYYPALADWYARATLRRAALTHALSPDRPALTLLPTDDMHSGPAFAPDDTTWLATQSNLIPLLQFTPFYATTLFLHQRLTPAGQPRLVAVNLHPLLFAGGIFINADLRLFTTGSLLSPRFTEIRTAANLQPHTPSAHQNNFPRNSFSLGIIPWSSDFRLYPAQPDPQDPTKFSLPYTLNQTKGSFIFQLTNDDSVQITTPTPLPPVIIRPLSSTRGSHTKDPNPPSRPAPPN